MSSDPTQFLDEEQAAVEIEVEITYIDPSSGSVCRRQAYCDPEDWKQRSQARLLVSSDLVNSLSEAVGIWFGRFRQIHQRLEDCRMGYFFELFSLRQSLKKLQESADYRDQQESRRSTSSSPLPLKEDEPVEKEDGAEEEAEEENAPQPESPQGPKEVCPVHFFNPDQYLDGWTQEMLQKSVLSFRSQLDNEIASINERINVQGGGTWRQLLAFFIKKGVDPIEMVVGLLHAIEDPLYRREIVNTMTNGLQDLYDALLLQFDSLQEENQDMNDRMVAIGDLELKQKQAIMNIQKQMAAAREKLAEPGFEEPPEEDDAEEVAEAQAKMFEEKAGSLKAYMAEVRRLRQLMEEWQERLATECDMEAFTRMEEEQKEWKRKIRNLKMQTESRLAMVDTVEERTSAIEEKIAKQTEACDMLREKMAKIPGGINTQSLKLQQMKRRMRELESEAKKIKAAMGAPMDRIKAMRSQLRVLYKKLGWDWDLSDSDDDDGEDKPYWQRRKIAVNGFLPFNQHEFLDEERVYHARRKKKRHTTIQGEEKVKVLARMQAKRQGLAETKAPSPVARSITVDEDQVPFGKDEPSRDPIDPVQRAISSARERLAALPGQREAQQETPSWNRSRREQEREKRQADLDRLLQLRESFEIQLEQCVECFVDLLPDSGVLGDLRSRLVGTLAKLGHLPENPANWQAQEVEQEIQATCEDLQSMIEEAISHGDQVHHFSAAMMHSVRFSELRTLLSEVLQSEHQMREALAAHRSTRRRSTVSRGESPPITPSARQLLAGSNDISPTSDGDGSDGDISALAMATSSHELSDSLQLPPRLLAQTTPLLGGRQPKKDARKKVDFGFRPDGAGEESVENWSLFKVSKATTSTSFFGDSVSTGLGLTTSSGFICDKMRKTETKVRRHRAAVDCDFHEYMSQARQMSEGSWQTASAPSLLTQGKKKRLPHLPKLVNSGSAGRSLAGSNSLSGFSAKGDVLASWERSPPRISVPSITVPNKKFGATAPPDALFTKW